MRATFMNRLVFAEPNRRDMIKYVHQFRVDVNIFVQKKEAKDRDWDIAFIPANATEFSAQTSIPFELRKGLLNEFMVYVRRRMRKGLENMTYDDFVTMTKAMNIV